VLVYVQRSFVYITGHVRRTPQHICELLRHLSTTLSLDPGNKVTALIVQDRDFRAPEVLQYENRVLELLASTNDLPKTFNVS
jgi:hypothetical protein